MCLVNLAWIYLRFKETLSSTARAEARDPRIRNPLSAIFGLSNVAVRRANLVAFIYSLAFVAMETSITFLAAERFGYTARQNGYLLGFLGLCSIVTQGYIVRKLLAKVDEVRVLNSGLIFSASVCSSSVSLLNRGCLRGLACLATGSGLVNPATSGLISLYSGPQEQGRVLGIFRSLGSLSRAITPILAGAAFWLFGSRSVFIAGALACRQRLWPQHHAAQTAEMTRDFKLQIFTVRRSLPAQLCWIFSIVCLFFSSGCLSSSRRSPARTIVEAQTTTLPARVISNFFVVESKLSDGKTYRFIVDTGSTATLVSPDLAKRFAMKERHGAPRRKIQVRSASGGEIDLESITLRQLNLGDALFEKVPALIFDFTDFPAIWVCRSTASSDSRFSATHF